jgi:glycosyltransferase involved in cell wall biosynthesis
VVANSSAGLMANNINPGKNHFVLNNGIESKFENNLPQGEKEERKKRIIPGYKSIPGIIFISIANLVPYKDYFTVLTALKSIKEEYNFYYFIIGDGSLKNKIETRINKFGLSKNVILTGKIFNVEDYIKISDIMIHSSRGEGISNAILESMYAGLPIIASKVGGIPETVFPKSSMLFPYKDYKVLYNCLSKVPQAFNNFNPQSSEYKDHLGKFSVNTMVNKFEEIVSSIKTQS